MLSILCGFLARHGSVNKCIEWKTGITALRKSGSRSKERKDDEYAVMPWEDKSRGLMFRNKEPDFQLVVKAHSIQDLMVI